MTSRAQTSMTDKIQASASNGAALAVSKDLKEAAVAEGVYHATLWFPRGQDVGKYIKTRDMIEEIKGAGLDHMVNHLKRLGYLERKMSDFEQDFEVQWSGVAHNVVATVGKNLALDTYLAGASYTVVGPFMGLISSTSFTAVNAADTMSSHSGWLEAGNANTPTYTSPRKTAAWSSASSGSKSLSAALSFSMTGTGTVKGCFLVYGSGALTTIDNTAGTLYSAGLFTGGDQPVVNGNTLSVSYTTSL